MRTKLGTVLALCAVLFFTSVFTTEKANAQTDHCAAAANLYNSSGYSCNQLHLNYGMGYQHIFYECSGQGLHWTMDSVTTHCIASLVASLPICTAQQLLLLRQGQTVNCRVPVFEGGFPGVNPGINPGIFPGGGNFGNPELELNQ